MSSFLIFYAPFVVLGAAVWIAFRVALRDESLRLQLDEQQPEAGRCEA